MRFRLKSLFVLIDGKESRIRRRRFDPSELLNPNELAQRIRNQPPTWPATPVAQHDGRELGSWRKVSPPVPYVVEGGVVKKGVVRPGIGHQLVPETMHGLFEDFNRIQNIDFKADHPVIVDQTGLPEPPEFDPQVYPSRKVFREEVLDEYFVATDSPWFRGKESRQMAQRWFEEELGITFTEEQRPMTIHVVRRKD